MDTPQDSQDSSEPVGKLINLTKSINLRQLISEGSSFEVNFDDIPNPKEEFFYQPDEACKFSNPNCSGLIDEEVFDAEPFQILAEKMSNLEEDGLIKKRVLRDGYGDVMPENATVTINFNAYTEYNDEPFDSTYIRKRPFIFTLNTGMTIPGLDISVQSMKLAEKSQFLIDSKYAYGPLGCLQRVPANATVLFEIEVMNYVDAGAAVASNPLAEGEEQDFDKVNKYVHALCAKGNELFTKGSTKAAIKSYNQAVATLEKCKLRDYEEQEKQQKLLLRLLTNLVVSYTKLQEPRRACTNCNKIYYICKGTSLRVPAKVHFNHGRCGILLGDYDLAERKLKQAQRLEPQNTEISKELQKLDHEKKLSYNRELTLAKAIFKNNEINTDEAVSKEFKLAMADYCKELVADTDSVQYNLPASLTDAEIAFCKAEVQKYDLKFISLKQKDSYMITKQN